MRFRPPSADPFSIAVALLVGGCAAVVVPAVGFGPSAAGAAVLAAGVAWVLVEQVPDHVDRAADARLYLPLGGAAFLPLVVDIAGDALGSAVVPESYTLPAVGFSFVGIILVETGRRRRANNLRSREAVHVRLAMAESSRRLFVLSTVSALTGAGGVRLVAGERVGLPLLVGAVGGTVVGLFLLDTADVDLFVLDRGLVVVPKRRFGVSVVPWRRVRRVSVTDRTLRVERGLPWPMSYERTLPTASEARELRDTLRRYRRSG
jgi:hypothetical protein